MKSNILICFLFIFFAHMCFAQNVSSNKNYLLKSKYKVPETSATDFTTKQYHITYYDGFARPEEYIQYGEGGQGEHIIIPVVYDPYGNEIKKYLPYAEEGNSLYYRSQAVNSTINYNNSKFPGELDIAFPNPCTETLFEGSPLNRPVQVSSPGKNWKVGGGHTIKYEYKISKKADHVKQLRVSHPQANRETTELVYDGEYGDNVLHKKIVKDENYLDDYHIEWDYHDFITSSTTTSSGQNVELEIVNGVISLHINMSYYPFNSLKTGAVKTFDFDVKNVNLGNLSSNGHDIYNIYIEDNKLYLQYIFTSGFIQGATYNTTLSAALPLNVSDKKDHTTEEFIDKSGKTILKRAYDGGKAHDTYYVYDKYDMLTYVIPPIASDRIFKKSLLLTSPLIHHFPWTDLILTEALIPGRYASLTAGVPNSELLNVHFPAENDYGGRGGFSISYDDQNNISLDITTNTDVAMPYRTGTIASLVDYGKFSDQLLGTIADKDYEYDFQILNNEIVVTGHGMVPSLNTRLHHNVNLGYTKNYAWTKFCVDDRGIADVYDSYMDGLDNSEILNTNYFNFDTLGGAAISLDDSGILSLSLNITSPVAMDLRTGPVLELDPELELPDCILGTIYSQFDKDGSTKFFYEFSVQNNILYVEGYGKVKSVTGTFINALGRNIDQTIVEDMCYIYHYDKRNRVVEKYIPDNGWTYMVYDKLDRPVMTQDENQRMSVNGVRKWLFIKYDKVNRVAYTGQYSTNMGTRTQMQNHVSSLSARFESRITNPFILNGAPVYYSNNVFPQTDYQILTVNYYDDYNFNARMDVLGGVPANSTYAHRRGLLTGSWIRILGTEHYDVKLYRYDDKERQIKTWNYNSYLNTWNMVDYELDFTGKILSTKSQHRPIGGEKVIVWDYFTYDNADRPLQHTQVLGENPNGAAELISSNKYDDLGALVRKKVGGKFTPESTYSNVNGLQRVDFSYNIRGWLNGINNIDNDITATDDLFEMGIEYHGLYNGNIAGISSGSKIDNQLKDYSFKYDALNRLKDASYKNSSNPSEKYHENGITYDKNGNIKSLSRWGDTGNSQFIKIDELVYKYKPNSNRLVSVDDSTYSSVGFADGNSSGDDYDYDESGNLIYDKNKKIVNIEYNLLSLPKAIIKDNGDRIDYIYDANGNKIEKKVNQGGTVSTTNYSAGFIYENNVLQYFTHSEGYVQRQTNGKFSYVYQYKDHLGNVRLSYSDLDEDGVINDVPGFYDGFEGTIDWNSYYSFGELQIDTTKSHSGNSSGKISSPGPNERYSHSGVWLNIDNAQDTYYTYTVYAQSDGPAAEIVLFMNDADEDGYFSEVNSKSQYVTSTGWTKIENTYLVKAGIKRLNIRLDVNSQGTVWFDDISLKKNIAGSSEIVDTSDYYPFGMEHNKSIVTSGGNSAAQKIKYNGKELQEEIGLGAYDYGARNYDPVIGRWFNTDPLAEKYYDTSPYVYGLNNPLFFVDPDGRYIEIYYGVGNKQHVRYSYIKNRDYSNMDSFLADSYRALDALYTASQITLDDGQEVNLLGDIIKSEKELSIADGREIGKYTGSFFKPGKNYYDSLDPSIGGNRAIGLIYFNSEKGLIFDIATNPADDVYATQLKNGKLSPTIRTNSPTAIFGHEIGHAWNYLTKGWKSYYNGKGSGPVQFGKFEIKNQEETNATTLSNKINANLHESIRVHYGGFPVLTKGVLSNKLKL